MTRSSIEDVPAVAPKVRIRRRAVLLAAIAVTVAVAMAGIGAVVVNTPTASAATVCPTGVWSYHQTRTGGCGYGNITKGASSATQTVWFKLNGSVGDNLADGSCVRVEILIRARFVSDSIRTYKACGTATATQIAFSDTAPAAGSGSIQVYSVRLCVGSSCSAYIDYFPA